MEYLWKKVLTYLYIRFCNYTCEDTETLLCTQNRVNLISHRGDTHAMYKLNYKYRFIALICATRRGEIDLFSRRLSENAHSKLQSVRYNAHRRDVLKKCCNHRWGRGHDNRHSFSRWKERRRAVVGNTVPHEYSTRELPIYRATKVNRTGSLPKCIVIRSLVFAPVVIRSFVTSAVFAVNTVQLWLIRE